MSLSISRLYAWVLLLAFGMSQAEEPVASGGKASQHKREARVCSVHETPLIEEMRFVHGEGFCVDYGTELAQYFVVAIAGQGMPHFLIYDTSPTKTQAYSAPISVSYCKHCESAFWVGYERFKKLPSRERQKQLSNAREAMQEYTAKRNQNVEQGGVGEPATRAESDSEGSDKSQPKSEGRAR